MHAKTALAVAGSVLAVPSAALAANHAPDSDALHPSGKLTHDVPTAPDPDVSPGGTEEVPAPPARDVVSDLPQ